MWQITIRSIHPEPVGPLLLGSQKLEFNPETMLNVAMIMEQQHKRFISCTQNIVAQSEKLAGSWQGDQEAWYLDNLYKLEKRSQKLAAVLLELSRDVASASGIYRVGEREAKQVAEALPTEGVFLV